MPSPLAHLAAGYFVYRGAREKVCDARSDRLAGIAQLAVILALSQLPDLDSVVGFFSSDFGAYHNQYSHSLLTGIPVALLAAGIAMAFKSKHIKVWFWIALLSYELHVFMDYLTVGRGVRLLWPLTTYRFQAPVKLFYGLHWSEGLVSVHHLWTLLSESLSVLLVWFIWTRIRQTK